VKIPAFSLIIASFLPPFKIACFGHLATHAAHLTHFAGSIRYGCFGAPEIAPAAQAFAQRPQATHFSSST